MDKAKITERLEDVRNQHKAAMSQYNQLGVAREQQASNVNVLAGRMAELEEILKNIPDSVAPE